MVVLHSFVKTKHGITTENVVWWNNRIFDVTVYSSCAGFQLIKVITDGGVIYTKMFASSGLQYRHNQVGNTPAVQLQIRDYVINQMFSDMVF